MALSGAEDVLHRDDVVVDGYAVVEVFEERGEVRLLFCLLVLQQLQLVLQ